MPGTMQNTGQTQQSEEEKEKNSEGTLTPLNVDIEEAEIEMCNRHKRYFEDTKANESYAWRFKLWVKGEVDVQRDICLFKARYSSSLKLKFICGVCSEKINGRWYRCLHCTNFNLCTDCYENGKTTSEHLDSHKIIELRYKCDGCDAFIVETCFHCNVCSGFHLCMGCYKSGKYPKSHESSHQMTRLNLIPSGLLPSTTYHRASMEFINRHSWLQQIPIALPLSDWLRTWKEGM